MKRSRLAIALALAASSSIAAVTVVEAGNGAPQGPHEYQLNIIGTSDKNADMDDNNGRRIFVPLFGKTAIYLQEGPLAVIDANGTDSDGATFQLPAPGYDAHLVGDPGDADVTSNYSIFIRPLGKPGGWATITTCAELVDSTFAGLLPGTFLRTLNREGLVEGTQCSIEQVGQDILMRTKGKSSFTNVTAELTSVVFEVVYIDADGNEQTVQIRVPIFDEIMDGEYWEYDNNGLRLAQLRFFDCSTNVETGESTCNF
jgi:hypothetical protein